MEEIKELEEKKEQESKGAEEEGNGREEEQEVAAMVAEAEQRGYLRGRNERIEQLMSEPGMLEREERGASLGMDNEEVKILQRERISIWDL